jgi:dipeptidyl aminopeptidase/acylaminoacyl peptidase
VAKDTAIGDAVLVAMNRRDRRVFDLYRVDPDASAPVPVREGDDIADWLVNGRLEVVGAVRHRDDGTVAVVVPDGPNGWRVVAEDLGDQLAFLALDVTAAGDVIVLTDKDANTRHLARLDLDSGLLTSVFSDPTFDVTTVTVHPTTREPQMLVVERELAETIVLDPDIADDMAALYRLHGGRPVVLSRDGNDRQWIVGYIGDGSEHGPVAHYLWDRETRAGRFLFDHRPSMNAYQWAPMEPFEFTARDGLRIHGYLTFPPGLGRHSLPAVVAVHGGPWRRHVWGFDREAQWLANRGALCVQVNFRGSTGYGKEFLDAGDREWGGRMQDDLVDAVEHLGNLGVIDRSRVGIMGSSYGGYAALCGVVFTPDVFACAVARVAPANLITFIESVAPYWQPRIDLWHRRIGHPERDRDLLWDRSPLSRAGELSRPLLLTHGARDARVPRTESDVLVAALEANGIDHEYLVLDDEGHRLLQAANLETYYGRAEAFLTRHLRLTGVE